MNTVNIFTRYEQKENDVTNGFVSILSLSRFEGPQFVSSFLRDELRVAPNSEIESFCVLQGFPGTADGELRGKDCCIWIETKIVSGTLRKEQIRRHLNRLRDQPERVRRLLLLTPDDSGSRYIQQFLSLNPTTVLHVGWRRAYDFLARFDNKDASSLFSELVRQFLERIHDTIFAQDIAGIILKIDFGDKSGVYAPDYLSEMRRGEWTTWNTPREYKSLDGSGRKLMLYDRTRQGITAEVEIEKVKRTCRGGNYPWTNVFAPGTLHLFEHPLPLFLIREVPGFENFGLYRKDRSAFRNITHEQYRKLTGNHQADSDKQTGEAP